MEIKGWNKTIQLLNIFNGWELRLSIGESWDARRVENGCIGVLP